MVLEHIQKLLFDHDCVIMPDFGGLITHYQPARIHPVRHTFSPPTKRVAFNEKVKINDGLLISTLAYDNKLSANEAQQQVTQFVQELQRELNRSRRFDLKGIGIFRLNEESKINFEYVENENYLSDAFGLLELLSKPVIAPEPIILRTLLKEQAQPAKAGFRGAIRRYYRAATALMIGGVIVTGLYLLSVQTDYNVSAINPITLFQSASEPVNLPKKTSISRPAIAEVNPVAEVPEVTSTDVFDSYEPPVDSSTLPASETVKEMATENREFSAETESKKFSSEVEAIKPKAPENKIASNTFIPKELVISPGEAVLISAKAEPVPEPVEPKEVRRNFTVDEIKTALSTRGPRITPESTSTQKVEVESKPSPEKNIAAATKAPDRVDNTPNPATNTPKPFTAPTIKPKTERFYVIVNGYASYENAERNRKIIAKKGLPGQIITPYDGSKLYRIAIAEYSTRDQAIQNLPELKNKYGNTIWILKR